MQYGYPFDEEDPVYDRIIARTDFSKIPRALLHTFRFPSRQYPEHPELLPPQDLPVGVYAVSTAFDKEDTFVYQGEHYRVNLGVNCFTSLEDLSRQTLERVREPFMDRSNVTIVLIPAGVLPVGNVGKTNAERFKVVLPTPIHILGENVHNHPNTPDLVEPGKRRPESIIEGSYYFGAIAFEGDCGGEALICGLTLRTRIRDSRTHSDEHTGLTVQKCIIESNIPGNIIHVTDAAENSDRFTEVQDCRCIGISSMNADGNLLQVDAGKCTLRSVYMINSDKNLLLMRSLHEHNAIRHILINHLRIENCNSRRCIEFRSELDIRPYMSVTGNRFLRATRPGKPLIVLDAPHVFMMLDTTLFVGSGKERVIVYRDLQTLFFIHRVFDFLYPYAVQFPQRRTKMYESPAFPIEDPHDTAPLALYWPLRRLYGKRKCLYGDFHCHSDSGGTSDGKTKLANYVPDMHKVGIDFAAIVDHRQMRHFFLDEWDEKYLICGTEPGCMLNAPDRSPIARKMDYTMIFPDKKGLAKVMEAFPQFKYTGGTQGTYVYANHTPEDLAELGEFVYNIGGLLSHAHPKQLMVSDDPLDYYFGEHVAIETVHGHPSNLATEVNRELWIQLLKLGKRVKTHGSSDSHGPVSNVGLTAVYPREHHSAEIFNTVRAGNCTAGGVGMQMCIGSTPIGGVRDYKKGLTLLLQTDKFHPAHWKEDTVYSLRIYTDRGLAWAKEFLGEPTKVALKVQPRKYYRAEVWNESDDHVVAMTNPIWLND